VSTPLAPPNPEDVHVWQVRLDVDGDELHALTSVLSADERERTSRFVRPCDASRSAAARGHLRQLLGHYLDRPAAEVALGVGPHGKPFVSAPGAGWLRFNMSHSGDRGLIAVANGREVGVDVERFQPELPDPELRKLFAPAEQRALSALTAGDYIEQYFTLWTRKEAVVKGLGVGLLVPLNGVDVLNDRVPLTADLARNLPPVSTSTWNVRSLRQGENYFAAVAVQAPAAPTAGKPVHTFPTGASARARKTKKCSAVQGRVQ